MDDHTKRLWLKINTIVKDLAHLKYWTIAEEYHSDVVECYNRLHNIKDRIAEAK